MGLRVEHGIIALSIVSAAGVFGYGAERNSVGAKAVAEAESNKAEAKLGLVALGQNTSCEAVALNTLVYKNDMALFSVKDTAKLLDSVCGESSSHIETGQVYSHAFNDYHRASNRYKSLKEKSKYTLTEKFGAIMLGGLGVPFLSMSLAGIRISISEASAARRSKAEARKASLINR